MTGKAITIIDFQAVFDNLQEAMRRASELGALVHETWGLGGHQYNIHLKDYMVKIKEEEEKT